LTGAVPPASAASARLAVQALAPAPSLDEPVRQRDTTTLLTVDGTLLHRDRFTLGPVTRPGAALDIALPAGSTLWSARVGDQPVRPLERGGKISVPLGFVSGSETVVEVVSVQERAIPAGRSELGLELPQVTVPVLDHRWRVLLPEANRYRFRSGDLRPAPAPAYRYVPQESQAAAPALSHGGTASILGRVVDDQGAALPGVTLMATRAGLQPLMAVSDAQGQFRLYGLTAGSYAVKAELEGFGSQEYPNVQVVTGSNVEIEITMSSAVEDVITVTAESPMLDERKTGRTESIPLNEGRGGGSLNLDFLKRKKKAPATPEAPGYFDFDSFGELKQGLVGGVRPLPVTIPESGKAIFLTGALPPARVAVELEVKAKRK
jgi:hypothetical protein